jgi:Holliday junction resolvase RusA-like endonuclease
MADDEVQLALIAEAAPLRVAAKPFVCFEIAGEPRAWERPGATIRWEGSRPYIHWYIRAEEARWRESIAWVAKAAMRGRKPASEAVALLTHLFIAPPASWSWKRKQAARSGAILPTGRPDADNYLKGLTDAMIGIVFEDDALIVDTRAIKRYSDRPALRVEIREMLPPATTV